MAIRKPKTAAIPDRPVGLLGRLPSQFPGTLCDLTYYAAGPLPKAPATVKVPAVKEWGMLANDVVGDCGVASLEHVFMADAIITDRKETDATAAQAKDFYFTYTGGQDSGVVLSQYLSYVRTHGYFGRSVNAFAPVSIRDIPTLQTAVNMFGAAYTGITVTAAMQQAFSTHQPWTTTTAEGQILGGHAVPIVGYDDAFLYAVTWGGVQAITYSAWSRISSEAWCVITGEFVEAKGDWRGFNLAALNEDLDRLAA